ncbi:metallophosphoesterase [Thermoleptolyngbya oregonensis NK1-22]|uniref:Metallophosphoesterase n=1 Tax=Thermoleptolyngbya oregonensis NK1-22 TaxID=2547457 RepID=A0AA96Y3R3_9CYAN|nr:metallophosphoesterase [Thermoleptolyngbya oregonensis]WOB44222.1 metallophosphoesterase [Thermoleptolyngbya oregonensis NK1-22]
MHPLLTGPLTLESVTVHIADLPPSCNGLRIAQLSDFHYDGLGLSDELLEEAIALVNRLQPDLVALTGDFVTHDPSPIEPLSKHLKALHSRLGRFAVLGNHDSYRPGAADYITRTLTAAGIEVLRNQIAYPLGDALPLVGLADFWSKAFSPKVLESLPSDRPRLVLSHNPDSAAALANYRVDLQLSGHTHGGQIVIPGVRSPQQLYFDLCAKLPCAVRRWLPFGHSACVRIVRHWDWAQGLHSVGRNQLYVNRGLGTYLPGRFLCPPEVTLLTLRPF